MIQTEYEFTLPIGYQDERARFIAKARCGWRRLPTKFFR